MIRTRRRKRVVLGGNIENDSPQPRTQLRSNNNSRSRNMAHNSHQQVRNSNNICNSVKSSVDSRLQSKNPWAKYSTGDISSSGSEDESFYNFSRHGSLKNLSDYETGESSDRNLRSTRAGMIKKNHHKPNPSTSQQFVDSDSSSDDSVLSPRVVKNLKRPLSPTSTSGSSDSDVPYAPRMSIKRIRVFSSSVRSSSGSSSDTNDEVPRPATISGPEDNTSNTEKVSSAQFQLAGNSSQEREGSPVILGPSVRKTGGRKIPVIESESESDLVTTNHTVRGRRIPVIDSEDDNSCLPTRENSRISPILGVTQRVSSYLGIHDDVSERRNVLLCEEGESSLTTNATDPVSSRPTHNGGRRQIVSSNILNLESGQNVWTVTNQADENEDNGVPMSNRRRVRGRRIPVVESEDESESDTAMGYQRDRNESSIPDGGNEIVNILESDVINLRSRIVPINGERGVVSNYNTRRSNFPKNLRENSDSSDSDIRPRSLSNRIIPVFHSDNSSNYNMSRSNVPVSEDSDSSDSDIRPRSLSNRILPVFQSDDSLSTSSSSSTDSNDSIIRISRRRPRPIPIVDDYEDITNNFSEFDVNVKVSINVKVSAKHEGQNENSSDSDGESEKCPICLVGFKLQEIGKPNSCDHKFCSLCIKEWATKNNTCPIDRIVFDGIIVYDKIEGEVIQELPVEKPNPQPDNETDMGRIEEIVAELFSESSDELSWYFDSDDDGPEEMCVACGTNNQPHRMISCDSCNSVYHLGCVMPPLHTFPTISWYCLRCEYETDTFSDSD